MKRIVLLIAISLLAITTLAQSEQSNELFAQGVELYHAGNYIEAIPFFQRCDSIDKVELGDTELLMTEFYRNLANGQPTRESFFNAQKFLRHYNGGQYDKPEYWAAFILLDGLY